jgi:transposase-like protein
MELMQPQLEAVELVFEDRLTDLAIAEKVGIDVRTLRRWRKLPEFAAELQEIRYLFAHTVRQRSAIAKVRRLDDLFDRHRLLRNVIAERAAHADPEVPGDNTGIILKRFVNTKEGLFVETRVDHATLRELSHLESAITAQIVQIEINENKRRKMLDDEANEEDFADTADDLQTEFKPEITRAESQNRSAA